MPKKKKYEHAGQPTVMTEKVKNEICDRLSLGESLLSICRDTKMPQVSTVYKYLLRPESKEFFYMYTHARELQADTYMDQCVDIADDTEQDKIILINKDGEEYEKTNFEHINRSRLRVDTRIKIAEKMAPRKYVSQQRIEHTGKGGQDLLPALTDEDMAQLSEIMDTHFKSMSRQGVDSKEYFQTKLIGVNEHDS